MAWDSTLTEDPPSGGGPFDEVAAAFAESSAHGLLALEERSGDEQLPAAWDFWRGFGRRLFISLCGLVESPPAAWKEVPAPDAAELEQLVESAPPMRGLEYLDATVLARHWVELAELVSQKAAECADGPGAFLQHVEPLFHQLGRVTFHLAENKRDPSRPFAFLATYAHRVSQRSKVAHLPLADALKSSASARDSTKLKALLAPVERAAERCDLVRELLASKALFSPQAWSIREAHRFLRAAPLLEEAGVVVRVPDWWSVRAPVRPEVRIRIGGEPPGRDGLASVLDFDVTLALEGQELTDDERTRLLAATDGLALLRGKWVEVDQDRLREALDHWRELAKTHAKGLDFIQGMRLLAGAQFDDSNLNVDGTAAWSTVVAGDWLRETLARMRQPMPDEACRPGQDLQATLRPYQVAGVHWLWFMTRLGLGSCLADDMGLGKTVQVIDLLLQRKRAAGSKELVPCLLVVPASLLGNWRAELARFAPQLVAILLHRSECDAETLDRYAAQSHDELQGVDLVITTYGLVRRLNWLTKITWPMVILDEAQAIKNAGANQTRCIKALRAQTRLILTGTPVENHLGDLWSLFDFVCPGLLGTASQFKSFIKRLNSKHDPQGYGPLRRLVRPYILRRLKSDPDVVPDLPAKTELRALCGLSKKQAVLYEKAVRELASQLESADGIQRRGIVLATLMQLKQICNHPSQALGRVDYDPNESGKFERLHFLCEPIVERQERALVFTQFQALTEPLARYLQTVFGRPGLVLHGGTPVARRTKLVQEFQSDDGPPFFVISLKAGGSGLNLTAASHVIHFDRWWNPAVENQATDRAFRIGQKRNVLVHKFVCRGTLEERIDELITSKQAMADQILAVDEDVSLTEMTDDELLAFVSLDVRRALEDE